jgi:hypothetical protein
MLSAQQSRVFFMHNVHEQAPTVFETRWTLSYLRGPMGREELRRAAAAGAPDATAPTASPIQPPPLENGPQPQAAGSPTPRAAQGPRPVLPAGIREFFLPGTGATVRAPALYGSAQVHYTDARRGVDVVATVTAVTPFSPGAIAVDWNAAERIDVEPAMLLPDAPAGADGQTFGQIPPAALNPRSYAEWSRDFEQWIARAQPLRLFAVAAMKSTSRPGESERDFRLRVQQAMREDRDRAVEKLRAKYAPKAARLAERAARAQDAVGREHQQVEQQKLQTAVSVGATLLGALMGRKTMSASTLGRATTAARSVSRSMKEAQDVARAQEKLVQVQAEQRELQAALDAEIAALSSSQASSIALETIDIKPKRGAIDVRLVALVWRTVRD